MSEPLDEPPDEAPRRDPRIAGTLSFALLVAANRIARSFAQAHGRRVGLGLPEWRCMMALAAEPDRSGEDIARAMGMEPMTVSRALRRLARHGRARARSDPARRRRNRWRLTDEGWAVVDVIAPDALARDAALLRRLGAPEAAHMVALLRRVVEEADAMQDGAAGPQ